MGEGSSCKGVEKLTLLPTPSSSPVCDVFVHTSLFDTVTVYSTQNTVILGRLSRRFKISAFVGAVMDNFYRCNTINGIWVGWYFFSHV